MSITTREGVLVDGSSYIYDQIAAQRFGIIHENIDACFDAGAD